MLVFSGSSNPKLASNLARKLKTRVGEMELSRFKNDECRVRITEKNPGKRAILVQSLSEPTDQHLMEFCLIGDALKRMGVKEIIGVIPWMSYTKQDKVFRKGEPLSAKVIAKMLQVVPMEKVITVDLHNLAILGFFEVPVENLSGRLVLTEYFKENIDDNFVVVSPDEGAIKSSTKLANDLGLELAYLNKARDLKTGKVVMKGISGVPVKGRKVLIKDDMIATGSTLIESAKALKKEGVKEIWVGATHHLQVKDTQEKLDKSPIDRMIVTNTISNKSKSKKLKILDIAGLIAKQI